MFAIFLDNVGKVHELISLCNQRSEWLIKIEDCNPNGVPMLDVFVSRNASSRSSVPHWAPYRKPTAISVPLSHLSAHPYSVHRSWPLGEIRRVGILSSTSGAVKFAKQQLLDRWREFGMPASILEAASSEKPSNRNRSEKVSRRIIWIVLDHHPVLSVCKIKSCIDEVCDTFRSIIEPEFELPLFQIAWKGSLKPLWLCLRNNHL